MNASHTPSSQSQPDDLFYGQNPQTAGDSPNQGDEPAAKIVPIGENTDSTEQTADQGSLPRSNGETPSRKAPPAGGGVTKPQTDKARAVEFRKLDEAVKSFGADSIKAGKALATIMEKQLWKVNFTSWLEYRQHLIGFRLVHIGRLVYAAEVVKLVDSENQSRIDQKLPLPIYEWQIRAIPRKLEDKDKLKVWESATSQFGEEPSHDQILEVLATVMPASVKAKTVRSKTDILDAFKEVEALIDAHAPGDDIKSALNRLSKILKLDKVKSGD